MAGGRSAWLAAWAAMVWACWRYWLAARSSRRNSATFSVGAGEGWDGEREDDGEDGQRDQGLDECPGARCVRQDPTPHGSPPTICVVRFLTVNTASTVHTQ